MHNLTYVLIHGYMKTPQTWDKLKTKINNANIVLIHIENYTVDIEKTIKDIDASLQKYENTRIILAAHSYGAFYAIGLNLLDKKKYKSLFLIDPTLKTESYKQYLEKKYNEDRSEVNKYKLEHYDTLPSYFDVPSSAVVWCLVNVNSDSAEDYHKIIICKKLTSQNVKSSLQVFIDKSHMLHEKCPDKIYTQLLLFSSI